MYQMKILSALGTLLGLTVESAAVNLSAAAAAAAAPYKLWCVGNCDTDVTKATTPGVVLMGGGQDTEQAFEWQIEHANGGDFLVLRASGDDAYNDWIYNISKVSGHTLNSVTTILCESSKASSDPTVLKMIENAEAVFFAGGDQSDYYNYWSNTEVQRIIQSKISTQTIGGTSAGLAILGDWVYTADGCSAVSGDVLLNPYDKCTKNLKTKFLDIPFMQTILTDTHFVTRDRMGRMLGFLARIRKDNSIANGVTSRALGVDEHTALLLDVVTGDVVTVGSGTAYLCSSDHSAEVCEEKVPLTFHDISCRRLSAMSRDQFSFSTFTGDGVSYINDVTAGVLTEDHYGPAL